MANCDETLLQSIAGAAEVAKFFGYWPSFHDAEVISLLLDRSADSILKVHTFHTHQEVNERGQYRTTKHLAVCFLLRDIQALELNNFNSQNVISGLGLSRTGDALTVTLHCCYGLCGSITAKGLRITLEVGIPSSSVYANAE